MEENYWIYIENAYDKVSIYDGPKKFANDIKHFPDSVIDLLAAHWFLSEVQNGGIMQFYTNPTGVLAPEVVKGFKRIGLLDVSVLVEKSIKVFGNKYPRKRKSRVKKLYKITKSKDDFDLFQSGLFDEIEQSIYQIGGIGLKHIYDEMDTYAKNQLGPPGALMFYVVSNYGRETNVISENTSLEIIAKTMKNLDWQGFHQVVLERRNGDWLEVGGSLNPSDGLSVMYEEKGERKVIKDPPTSVDEMIGFLFDYFENKTDWKLKHNWN